MTCGVRFRAALIGCGNIGSRYDEREPDGAVYTHAGMYHAAPEIDLVCAAEPDHRRRAEAGRFWGLSHLYCDYRAMLAAEVPDIVSIATPDGSHADILRDVLSHPSVRAVFCEKPLAPTAAAAAALQEDAERRGVHLCVDYVRRWDANHRRVRDLLAQGGLGRLERATGYYVRGLRHNGCQLINLVRFFLGRVARVQAVGRTDAGSVPDDPSLDLVLETARGVPVHLLGVDGGGYSFSMFEIDLFGSLGRLRIADGGLRVACLRPGPDPRFPNFSTLYPADFPWDRSAYGHALQSAGRQFADVLAGRPGAAVENAAREAVEDLRIIEAAERSAAEDGRSIPIPTSTNGEIRS